MSKPLRQIIENEEESFEDKLKRLKAEIKKNPEKFKARKPIGGEAGFRDNIPMPNHEKEKK